MIEGESSRWPVLLFEKSPLKQRKFAEITGLLGDFTGLHCLDIGADNGVISYLLREESGTWKSADLDDIAVEAIRDLVTEDVFQIDGGRTPFRDDEFDRVVIVDFLEHIHTDQGFIDDMFRIIRPGGELIINVPHVNESLLRKLRLLLGQTDEKHGHVRPGYTLDGLKALLEGKFTVGSYKTYSGVFSEAVDTLMTFVLSFLKRGQANSSKGMIMVEGDMRRHRKLFMAYSVVYPIVWTFVQLDRLLTWQKGYMLIVKAAVNKVPSTMGSVKSEDYSLLGGTG